MYYKIYGVMSSTGFHTEVANANTMQKAVEKLKDLDEKQYPFFAITEHLQSGSPALSIAPGVTQDRLPSAHSSLVDYRPNPMQNFELAEALFTKLKEKSDALKKPETENKATPMPASSPAGHSSIALKPASPSSGVPAVRSGGV